MFVFEMHSWIYCSTYFLFLTSVFGPKSTGCLMLSLSIDFDAFNCTGEFSSYFLLISLSLMLMILPAVLIDDSRSALMSGCDWLGVTPAKKQHSDYLIETPSGTYIDSMIC